MKNLILLYLALFTIQINAQKTTEQIKDEIREMEKWETVSYIARDYVALNKIWAKDIVVNSPVNRINKTSALLTKLLKEGTIQHKAIVRNIEELIIITDTIAISMGNEVVTNMDDTIIKRRYTNTWQLKDSAWKMSFRHANIICK